MRDGFQINWLIQNRLGGCARPESDAALGTLKAANTCLLISLTAEWSPDLAALQKHGMASLHVPIKDFAPPSRSQAQRVCEAITDTTGPVILHCAAGKGRTGTLLAAYLVHQGHSAEWAIRHARQKNPCWIETHAQIAFLHALSAPQ